MATLTSYPDAGTGGTTADGYLRRSVVDETFATIRAGAGTGSSATSTSFASPYIRASTTSNQWQNITRSGYNFDTSSIPASATITSQTLSLYGTNKANVLGTPTLEVVDWTPTNNNSITTADFNDFGSTSRGSVAYASFSTTGYNDITYTGTVVKEGITAIGTRLSWDQANSTTGLTWASGEVASSFSSYFADQTGTTNDPKLVVVYTSSSIKTVNDLAVASVKTINGLAIASVKTIMGLA